MKNYLFSFLAIIFLVVAFAGSFAVDLKNVALGSLYIGLGDFFSSAVSEELETLRAENTVLKSRLALEENYIPNETEGFISVRVYSSYPFNTRNELIIQGGTADGIKEVAPVVTREKVLVGFVSRVSEKTSSVRTIFDQDFEISVRIGAEEIDAFLRGGNHPLLTMIGKDENIFEGAPVVLADSRFPYGLSIGLVGEVFDTPAESFKSASIEIPYSLNKLRVIYVIDYET
ncbi:hypothetical protein A3A20_01165 [Candidatus Wolfebacteria bacterium RIFCSPLOWO2_01_FULL_45_19]|uniref:Cell shape-determining protein MreC n=1 Tax=Candidatus Wolfebacteria bacterium RIFCSPLOWO2_01_FULL_45_19 TaxID=1802557 RepID=A0A1F8DSD7_9BACT|nr:MAG: Cell shape-determining protein MreC [Parcubacteria group bacterium GW2011_GWB1_45_9]OGM91541.1 MAG: hypothetical protein A3A20_01165 [Candidatus Wolfebacteria bacterium RIFCSPLOWO2_01_FULL_45_19]